MRRAAAAACLALAVAGCGSADRAAEDGEVVVFAAASLTEVFAELGERFEAEHPGTVVTLNFGGSSALAKQLGEGAPADVFAPAAPANLEQVADLVDGQPATFARNRLTIAVPAGNPGGVTGLADLADEDRTIALCAEQVPCGAAARRALAVAGVAAAPDTLEQDVRAVLTKVSLGEVDAGLVYRTDVRSAGGRVEGIEFAESARSVTDYPIAVLADAPNPAGARAFRDFVLSPTARTILTAAGFEAP